MLFFTPYLIEFHESQLYSCIMCIQVLLCGPRHPTGLSHRDQDQSTQHGATESVSHCLSLLTWDGEEGIAGEIPPPSQGGGPQSCHG